MNPVKRFFRRYVFSTVGLLALLLAANILLVVGLLLISEVTPPRETFSITAFCGHLTQGPDGWQADAEATAMLDPRGREQVMQTIHRLNRDMGITVVAITHYMEEAAQADRVVVMSHGRIVMEGTPKEVFSQTDRVRALHLDVPQAAELRDELVRAGIPMPEGIIDPGECAQALYELLK